MFWTFGQRLGKAKEYRILQGKIKTCPARSQKRASTPSQGSHYEQNSQNSVSWFLLAGWRHRHNSGQAHPAKWLGHRFCKEGTSLCAIFSPYSTPNFVPACNISPSVQSSWRTKAMVWICSRIFGCCMYCKHELYKSYCTVYATDFFCLRINHKRS